MNQQQKFIEMIAQITNKNFKHKDTLQQLLLKEVSQIKYLMEQLINYLYTQRCQERQVWLFLQQAMRLMQQDQKYQQIMLDCYQIIIKNYLFSNQLEWTSSISLFQLINMLFISQLNKDFVLPIEIVKDLCNQFLKINITKSYQLFENKFRMMLMIYQLLKDSQELNEQIKNDKEKNVVYFAIVAYNNGDQLSSLLKIYKTVNEHTHFINFLILQVYQQEIDKKRFNFNNVTQEDLNVIQKLILDSISNVNCQHPIFQNLQRYNNNNFLQLDLQFQNIQTNTIQQPIQLFIVIQLFSDSNTPKNINVTQESDSICEQFKQQIDNTIDQIKSRKINTIAKDQLIKITQYLIQRYSNISNTSIYCSLLELLLKQFTQQYDNIIMFQIEKNFYSQFVNCQSIVNSVKQQYIDQLQQNITDSVLNKLVYLISFFDNQKLILNQINVQDQLDNITPLNLERLIQMYTQNKMYLSYNMLIYIKNCQNYDKILQQVLKQKIEIENNDFIIDNFEELQFLYKLMSQQQLILFLKWCCENQSVQFVDVLKCYCKLYSVHNNFNDSLLELYNYYVNNFENHITLNINLQINYVSLCKVISLLYSYLIQQNIIQTITLNQITKIYQFKKNEKLNLNTINIYLFEDNEPQQKMQMIMILPLVLSICYYQLFQIDIKNFDAIQESVDSRQQQHFYTTVNKIIDKACTLTAFMSQRPDDEMMNQSKELVCKIIDQQQLVQLFDQIPNSQADINEIFAQQLNAFDQEQCQYFSHQYIINNKEPLLNNILPFSIYPTKNTTIYEQLNENNPFIQFLLGQLLQIIKVVTNLASQDIQIKNNNQTQLCEVFTKLIIYQPCVNSMPTQEYMLKLLLNSQNLYNQLVQNLFVVMIQIYFVFKQQYYECDLIKFTNRRRSQNVQQLFGYIYQQLNKQQFLSKQIGIFDDILKQDFDHILLICQQKENNKFNVAQLLNLHEVTQICTLENMLMLLNTGVYDIAENSYELNNAINGLLTRFAPLLSKKNIFKPEIAQVIVKNIFNQDVKENRYKQILIQLIIVRQCQFIVDDQDLINQCKIFLNQVKQKYCVRDDIILSITNFSQYRYHQYNLLCNEIEQMFE